MILTSALTISFCYFIVEYTEQLKLRMWGE